MLDFESDFFPNCPLNAEMMDLAVTQHLFRNDLNDIGHKFVREAHVHVNAGMLSQFQTLN